MKITIRETQIRSETRYCVDFCPPGASRQRRFFPLKSDATKFAAELRTQQQSAGSAWIALTATERMDVCSALAAARAAGKSLSSIVHEWQSGSAAAIIRTQTTLAETIRLSLAARAAANCRPTYVRQLGLFFNQFARGRESLPLSEITLATCTDFLSACRIGPLARNAYIKSLNSLFNFAVETNLIPSNPIASLKLCRIDPPTPRILTNEQAAHLLRFTYTHRLDLLPYITLALLTGTRPQECDSITWPMIDLDRGLLRLSASQTKDRRARLVHLQPAAIQWLQLCQARSLPIAPLNFRGRSSAIQRLARAAAIPWSPDILRHTAASNLVESLRDVGRVALLLGNSPTILLKHYRSLVTPEQCAAFWALTPSAVLAT